jgi:chromosome segregation ATPase
MIMYVVCMLTQRTTEFVFATDVCKSLNAFVYFNLFNHNHNRILSSKNTMNFLGYTSTTKLNEKQELVDKLLDANSQFHQANGTLKSQVAKLKEQRTQAQRQVGDLTTTKSLRDEEINRLKQEIEGLKKTNFGLGQTLDEKNAALNRQVKEYNTINRVYKERGVIIERYKRDIHEKHGDIDQLNDRIDELTATLKQTNERYDAFVTVSGTNFAHHFERVLKKRKVSELTLD